jgi:rhodanese-related sulfurtransferase
MRLPDHVTICEVGTRDGFQIEPDFIPTDVKVEVVDLLSAAGVPRIEVTSFVHPKAVPQLRDAELQRRIRSLPAGREIVAYCRGPYCVYADDAVRLLRRRGFTARRLEDGWPEWERAGLATAVGLGGDA